MAVDIMSITFYFKKTKTGFTSFCDLMEMSIHKGIKGFGKTQDSAMLSLVKKWNKKADESYNELSKCVNITVKRVSLTFNR